MSDKTACCTMAKRLPPAKLDALNEELLGAEHRGFKKLAVAFGTNHMAVKRHKAVCLRQGAPGGEQEGEHAKEQGKRVGEQGGNTESVPVVLFPPGVRGSANTLDEPEPPRARAHVAPEVVGTHEERVLAIVARIADGRLVPSDVPTWAKQWGLHERTVRGLVREAYLHARVDRGTVEERRTLAMGMWETQIEMCDTALGGNLRPMDEAMLLRERREAVAGWCKAAGVSDDGLKIQINVTTHPIFVELMGAVMASLRGFPDARARVVAMLRDKATLLQQPPIDVDGVTVSSSEVER